MTNLFLLASMLLTNTQSAVTARTNGVAQISHVERVQRVEVTAWKAGKRIISRQTNVVNLPPRQWSEVVQDLTSRPVAPVISDDGTYKSLNLESRSTAPAAPQNARVIPPKAEVTRMPAELSTNRPAGPNTNSPAFKRRAEMEARRAEMLKQRQGTNQPAIK